MTANGSVAEMDLSFSLNKGILGHRVHSYASATPTGRWFRVERIATVECKCGAKLELDWRDLPEHFTTWGERMALAHYLNVLHAALAQGIQATSWPPPEPVPHSGELGRDTLAPDHDYEADDDFGFPDPDAPIPRRQHPPGTIR